MRTGGSIHANTFAVKLKRERNSFHKITIPPIMLATKQTPPNAAIVPKVCSP
jgi:hypothetical protein